MRYEWCLDPQVQSLQRQGNATCETHLEGLQLLVEFRCKPLVREIGESQLNTIWISVMKARCLLV